MKATDTDEALVRQALAQCAPPGAPSLPHQLAGWLVDAMVPLLAAVRQKERDKLCHVECGNCQTRGCLAPFNFEEDNSHG